MARRIGFGDAPSQRTRSVGGAGGPKRPTMRMRESASRSATTAVDGSSTRRALLTALGAIFCGWVLGGIAAETAAAALGGVDGRFPARFAVSEIVGASASTAMTLASLLIGMLFHAAPIAIVAAVLFLQFGRRGGGSGDAEKAATIPLGARLGRFAGAFGLLIAYLATLGALAPLVALAQIRYVGVASPAGLDPTPIMALAAALGFGFLGRIGASLRAGASAAP